MRTLAIAGAIGFGLAFFTSAHAAPLSFLGTTTPLSQTVSIDLYNGSSYGNSVATGFEMNDGFASFIAWCFDLDHSIIPGQNYDYVPTNNPFSSSTLTAGATDRAQSVFDANYASVDVFDIVEAAAFQLALWEVAYDNDFSITTGVFQASGLGTNAAAIEATTSTYLTNASNYTGDENWFLTYLEDNTSPTVNYQNLVTGAPKPPSGPGPAPVPLPAAAPLLVGAIGATALVRRRKSKA